ncbi:Gfo/Idh/MocA family oxidoreductase [Kribbella sp. NPDC056861]|uniref:Gfo/Idh/MocA family oxidoreductase n=1 Tax=Kribbella sp. NPDC056861 TaxID=3154857 RepID=UPI0034412A4B
MSPLRVIVAGTAFGRIYLEAVRSAPEEFELAGILAAGSVASREIAAGLNVPLYSAADQVPQVDIACVVVRSGALGGAGTSIAQSLLRRGVSVLQEHPVHPDELGPTLRVAAANDVAYAVNTLYPDLASVQRFLAVTQVLRRHPIRFVDAACAGQVAYPLVEILCRLAGAVRPFHFELLDGRGPFSVIAATIGGVRVTLRLQNQLHPADPDNHALLLHRLSVGTDAGVLALADTHGPVLWNPRLHAVRDSTGRLVLAGVGTERLAVPTTIQLGPSPGDYHAVFAELWPAAVLTALRRLRTEIEDPGGRVRTRQWVLGVATAWSALTAAVGSPELIDRSAPPQIPIEELLAAAYLEGM